MTEPSEAAMGVAYQISRNWFSLANLEQKIARALDAQKEKDAQVTHRWIRPPGTVPPGSAAWIESQCARDIEDAIRSAP